MSASGPDYTRAMRERRRAAGLCPYCGLCPPSPGRARCADCLAYNAAVSRAGRARRRAAGLCVACPASRRCPAAPGGTLCFLHQVRFRRANREHRRRLREARPREGLPS